MYFNHHYLHWKVTLNQAAMLKQSTLCVRFHLLLSSSMLLLPWWSWWGCGSTTFFSIEKWHWNSRCWNSQPSVSAFIRCYRHPSQSRLLLIFPGHIRPHSHWRITRPFLLYLYLCICVFAWSLLNGSIFYFWHGLIRYARNRKPLNNGTPKILSTDALTHNCDCFEFFPTNSTWTKIFWIKWHDADWALSSTVIQLGKSFIICKHSFLGRLKNYP